jgi:hypothetical protein
MNTADVHRSINQLEQVLKSWKMTEPTIRPELTQESRTKCILTLQEEWPDDFNHGSSSKLDDCVDWTCDKLNTWTGCKRLAWNIWRFNNKKEAEKFLTVFYLSWPNQ